MKDPGVAIGEELTFGYHRHDICEDRLKYWAVLFENV